MKQPQTKTTNDKGMMERNTTATEPSRAAGTSHLRRDDDKSSEHRRRRTDKTRHRTGDESGSDSEYDSGHERDKRRPRSRDRHRTSSRDVRKDRYDRDSEKRKRKKEKRKKRTNEGPDSEGREHRETFEGTARRIARRMREGGDDQRLDILDYDNEVNPFHDSNLSERFVWGKKIERDLKRGAKEDELIISGEEARRRQRMRMMEVELAKERRERREQEKITQEEEMEMINRERALAESHGWEKKEEQFHRGNSLRKSLRR